MALSCAGSAGLGGLSILAAADEDATSRADGRVALRLEPVPPGSTTQDLVEHPPKRAAIVLCEPSELAQYERALDRCDDGLHHGRPQQAGLLPLRDGDLAGRQWLALGW